MQIHGVGGQRQRTDVIWVVEEDDGTASVELMEGTGKKRIVMEVSNEGVPSLSFLDDAGRVVRRIRGDAEKELIDRRFCQTLLGSSPGSRVRRAPANYSASRMLV